MSRVPRARPGPAQAAPAARRGAARRQRTAGIAQTQPGPFDRSAAPSAPRAPRAHARTRASVPVTQHLPLVRLHNRPAGRAGRRTPPPPPSVLRWARARPPRAREGAAGSAQGGPPAPLHTLCPNDDALLCTDARARTPRARRARMAAGRRAAIHTYKLPAWRRPRPTGRPLSPPAAAGAAQRPRRGRRPLPLMTALLAPLRPGAFAAAWGRPRGRPRRVSRGLAGAAARRRPARAALFFARPRRPRAGGRAPAAAAPPPRRRPRPPAPPPRGRLAPLMARPLRRAPALPRPHGPWAGLGGDCAVTHRVTPLTIKPLPFSALENLLRGAPAPRTTPQRGARCRAAGPPGAATRPRPARPGRPASLPGAPCPANPHCKSDAPATHLRSQNHQRRRRRRPTGVGRAVGGCRGLHRRIVYAGSAEGLDALHCYPSFGSCGRGQGRSPLLGCAARLRVTLRR